MAVLGYGRFGSALCRLAAEAGHDVRAFDPARPVPARLHVPDAPTLLAGGDAIVLAVPIAALEDTLAAVHPHLEPRHLVLDVGSVKVEPERVLRDTLGSRVPWVASHPLFGSSSIARGELHMPVVLCPNPLHPEAVERAAALYESMGCSVHYQAADDHDRSMAYSHALAFFIAKGMLDIGTLERSGVVPPSFRAMRQTIESVRSDAGHLFLSIARENPFAGEARTRLLEALNRIDGDLDRASDDTLPPEATFAIPDLGPAAPDLRETRDLIDDVDRDLVDLIARRAQLARRAGRIKASAGRDLVDPARESELLDERRRWAERLALDPDRVAEIFDAIVRLSRAVQRE